MKNKILSCCLLLLSVQWSYAQNVEPFKDGDRVAFVGNSITEAGFYESYIWLYYMLHFPERKVRIMNVGIGGDVAGQINTRFEEDVMSKKPNVIALTFGMNDTGYFEYHEDNPDSMAEKKVATSYQSFLSVQKKLKQHADIKKILISSSPYDETVKNEQNYFPGKSKSMEKVTAFQKKAAQEQGWGWVDFYYPMEEINVKGQKTDPEFTITGPDRIHPGNGGHLVMAYLFLKAQNLTDPVAEVMIDSKAMKVSNQVNAKVSNLRENTGKVTFDYLAKSLPFPIDTISRLWGNDQKESLALEVVPFTEDFNREILQVSQLNPQQTYQIKIDTVVVGQWSGQELQQGINLATIEETPQYQQAETIQNLNLTRRSIEQKLREYYWMQFDFFNENHMLFDDDQHAVQAAREAAKENIFINSKMETYEAIRFPEIREAYQEQMDLLIDKIYQLNQPVIHHFTIEKITK